VNQPDRPAATPVPAFDPACAVFTAQSARPAGVEAVDFAALEPMQRCLLVIDGTVTQFLEAWTLEPVTVRVLAQSDEHLAAGEPWLALPPGAGVVRRSVVLEGARTGRFHAWAESLIAAEWATADVRTALGREPGGLGRVLIGAGAETRRECLWFGCDPGAGVPAAVRAAWRGPFLVRSYRVLAGGRPVMLITERFPL